MNNAMKSFMVILWMAAAAGPVMAQWAPGIDAPELSQPGPNAIGFIEKTLVQPSQVVPARSVAENRLVQEDRSLRLLVWYPAERDGQHAFYQGNVSAEPPLPRKWFNIPGTAARDAKPTGTGHPIVVISHGYGNDPVMMHWIGENLASKGYVTVAIDHDDLDSSDKSGRIEAIVRRPIDISFVLKEIRGGFLGDMADSGTIGLVGYSMGGYGILTAAGARLDPTEDVFAKAGFDFLSRYATAGEEAGAMDAGDVKALVAIAPGGKKPFSTWGSQGLAEVRAPLLLIAGDADRLVDFETGAKPVFEGTSGIDRTMLVFKHGGHNVGTGPIPQEMRANLWDQNWFDDPVWRKERMNAISLHFTTAFLDLHLKGVQDRESYLRVANPDSDLSPWKASYRTWDETSDGKENTAWKGFKRFQQVGLSLIRREAGD